VLENSVNIIAMGRATTARLSGVKTLADQLADLEDPAPRGKEQRKIPFSFSFSFSFAFA
jgi:hypothetical protein